MRGYSSAGKSCINSIFDKFLVFLYITVFIILTVGFFDCDTYRIIFFSYQLKFFVMDTKPIEISLDQIHNSN